MTEWIDVVDQKPDMYKFVLTYSKMPPDRKDEPSPITIARWDGKKWETLCNEEENNACACGDLCWATDSDEITHWMPLPKPPNDEKKESPLDSEDLEAILKETYHKPTDTQTNTSISYLQKREKLSYKQAKERYDSLLKA